MHRINKFKDFFENLIAKRPVAIVLSVLCAILIWFTVSVTVYPSTPITFYNIPLEVDLSGTQAEENGLSVVSSDVQTVTVKIVGDRSQVGILTAEDLTAYASVQSVNAAGEFSLDIKVESSRSIPFEVESISPSQVTVSFDKIETRTYDVTAAFPNIVIASGHTMDEVTCDPATIDITGPSAQLKAISKVVVSSDKELEIDTSYSLYSSDITLYTEDGAVMETDDLEIPSTNFQINIPVLTQKELPLTYDIRNTPSDFDVDWLRERLHLSDESITFASRTNASLAEREGWYMGYIKLEDIGLDFSTVFDIDLDEDYINQSGVQQVTLSFDSTGLSSRVYTVSGDNISVVNKPAGYDFSVVTKNLSITVIGPTEVLDALSTKDIVVTVDLCNYSAAKGASFTEDAVISFDGHSQIWAYGTYSIALNRTDDETATETTVNP
jgi:YbbR domain-containing protein